MKTNLERAAYCACAGNCGRPIVRVLVFALKGDANLQRVVDCCAADDCRDTIAAALPDYTLVDDLQ